eukprot:1141063-Pelagomonas_calceolata.AAC.10
MFAQLLLLSLVILARAFDHQRMRIIGMMMMMSSIMAIAPLKEVQAIDSRGAFYCFDAGYCREAAAERAERHAGICLKVFKGLSKHSLHSQAANKEGLDSS